LSLRQGGGVVIVDAATGIDPATVLELPLRGFLGADAAVQGRSSHALAMPEVIGLAEMIRGRPLPGRIVVIGARRFTLGRPLTRRVSAAAAWKRDGADRHIDGGTGLAATTIREVGPWNE
jgi:hypothetical protein